jgi:hypothetical protein
MPTTSAFSVFGTPMSAAWERGSPCPAELALSKSAEGAKFNLAKTPAEIGCNDFPKEFP